jgi:hypothetical protein
VRSRARRGRAAAARLRRDDFVVNQMEPDRARAIGILEVATHRIADRVAELIEVVGFREDRSANAACDVATAVEVYFLKLIHSPLATSAFSQVEKSSAMNSGS